MSSRPPGDHDRRRSPRFSCGGEARIVCLPSDGLFLPGRIRDLSLGGCCVETPSALDSEAHTEIVVRVNCASFRAVSQVRAIRDRAVVGMEFVHLSARGQDMLRELIGGLARLQAVTDQLRSERREVEATMLLRQLEREGIHAVLVKQALPAVSVLPSPTQREVLSRAKPEPLIVEVKAEIVPVDLFV